VHGKNTQRLKQNQENQSLLGENMKIDLTFMEAVEEMAKGNIVYHRQMKYKINFNDGLIQYFNDELNMWLDVFISLQMINEIWYIDIPDITLWDKKIPSNEQISNFVFYEKDIKDSLKEFICWCDLAMPRIDNSNQNFHNKVNEIFGKELIK